MCAKEGKDKDGNNLGVYSDGGVYCFSCGYSRSAQGTQRLKKAAQGGTEPLAKPVCLPRDVDFELPRVARDYLRGYALTQEDINVNRIMWSEEWQRLIFPYFGEGGLLGWQGRYLGNSSGKAKWYSQGDLKDIIHTCGNEKPGFGQRPVVLVEDIISAIRVGHSCEASALFGSHLSTARAFRYSRFYDKIIVWLDKDKELYSIKLCQHLRQLGLVCRSVITDKDPKEYSDQEIVDILK